MRNWALSLVASLILAAPAAATPPQVVWSTDRLFAITTDKVLILRTISDNQGYHQIEQTDTFLIIRDLATGRDISQTPVERVVTDSVAGTATHYPLEVTANPYAIRRDMQAAPLNDPRHSVPRVEIWDRRVRAVDHDGEVTHSLPWYDVMDQAVLSLQDTRDLLSPLRIEGDVDPYDPSYFFAIQTCDVTAATSASYLSASDSMLVQFTCEDVELGGTSVVWTVLPSLVAQTVDR